MTMEKVNHNGYEIGFDTEHEEWTACVDKQEGEWFCDKSLKKLKEALDKKKKGDFKRTTVWVPINRYSSGSDKKWYPHYGLATITSISPNGNIYYVEKGDKHAHKEHARWGYVYEDTPENRTAIAAFHAADKVQHDAEIVVDNLKEKIKRLDTNKLFKEIYGRNL